ncbi:hypothetical protein ABEF95_007717 [Exophiala dermatitidis]
MQSLPARSAQTHIQSLAAALEQLFHSPRGMSSLPVHARRALHQQLQSHRANLSRQQRTLRTATSTPATRSICQSSQRVSTSTNSNSNSLRAYSGRSQTRQFTSSSTTSPFSQVFRQRRRTPTTTNKSGGSRGSNGTGNSRRSYSSSSSSGSGSASEEKLSFSQRMKKLSREYGWSALGVYLMLTALDFPFCFLAVRWLGTDRIGHWEHVVVSYVKGLLKWPVASQAEIDDAVEKADKEAVEKATNKKVHEEEKQSQDGVSDHGYKEAEKANSGANASIWTQLALAYAIHKSFIFIRVPLTAAITPKVVKTLRSWGWNIGKRPKSSGSGSKAVSSPSSQSAGVNTKGSKVRPED